MNALLTLYAATSLHPGAGATTGAIDLPVQREVHTAFPVIAGSGLKGALRQHAAQHGLENGPLETVFGPPTDNADKHAGSLIVGEAKLLALPVRSLQSVFYWVSCPLVLDRLARDLAQARPELRLPSFSVGANEALLPEGNATPSLVLEELDFTARPSADLARFLAEGVLPIVPEGIGGRYREKLAADFAVVSDEDFRHLTETGTQVAARVVLDDRKTSQNLWYEETLPSESVFWSVLIARPPRGDGLGTEAEVLETVRRVTGRAGANGVATDYLLQVGGNETRGQGWCYTRLSGGGGA